MRLYSANIEAFYDHVRDNTLADTIRDNFKAHLGRYPGIPEYNSFNPNSAGIPREAGGGPSAMRARPDGVRPGFRARHNYASRPGRKAGGDFSAKIAEAGSRKTAMRFMRDYASRYVKPLSEPSRKLLDNTAKIISGEKALSLLNEQIVAKNLILAKLEAAKARAEKSVIIVHGGPGTGKSVIAFSPNPALRRIPRYAGGGPSAMRARPDGAYASRRAPAMRAENFSRSFQANLHDKQVVRGQEVGSTALIREAAGKLKATCEEVELLSQFRCNGSDGYLEWLDSTGPFAMPWETHDKVKPPEGYVKWFEWAFKPEGIKQVGCIYTAQGFEFDYIGVIIGKDFVYDPLLKKMTGNRIASFDRTLRQNAANFTEYARNIYRVLLSRGMKGCYVYFVDEETKAHFLSRIDSELAGTEPVTAAAPAGLAEKLKQALDILPHIPAALRWTAYLPVYSLQAACGNFGRGMAVEPLGWIKCPPGLKPDRNMFAAQVAGRSMEPRLQDGDYCVFRANPGGSRNNKLVLVQHSSIADPDTGGSYTVKKYTSKKKYAPDGAWQHEEIILKPLNPAYAPIVIPNAEDEEFMVVAEVVGKCGSVSLYAN